MLSEPLSFPDPWPTWVEMHGRKAYNEIGWRPHRASRVHVGDYAGVFDDRWDSAAVFAADGCATARTATDGCRVVPPRKVPWS